MAAVKKKSKAMSAVQLKDAIVASGEFVGELFKIRGMLGGDPDLDLLITTEATGIKRGVTQLLEIYGAAAPKA